MTEGVGGAGPRGTEGVAAAGPWVTEGVGAAGPWVTEGVGAGGPWSWRVSGVPALVSMRAPGVPDQGARWVSQPGDPGYRRVTWMARHPFSLPLVMSIGQLFCFSPRQTRP